MLKTTFFSRAQFQSFSFALRWPLITLTLMVAFALAGSFVSYEFVLANGHPWLPTKTCTGCALCGMTRAFCAMSAGHFGDAADWNPLGPATYILFWAWISCAGFLAARTIRHRRQSVLCLRTRSA